MRPPSKSALFLAAKAWNASVIKAIVGVSPNLVAASDPKGRLALHLAFGVRPGAESLGEPYGIETVSLLLDAGSNLESIVPMAEVEGDFRATPLWYAVARGQNLPLVRFLLQRGGDASYSLWAAVCGMTPR